MKTRKQCRGNWLMTGLVLLAVCGIMGTARAATGTWDGTDSAWDTTATHWTGVSGTPWDATNGGTNVAKFNTGGARAVVSETVYANGLTFDAAATVTNGTLSLAGANRTFTVNGASVTGEVFSALSGLDYSKAGSGTLVLKGANGVGLTNMTGGGSFVLAGGGTMTNASVGTIQIGNASAGNTATLTDAGTFWNANGGALNVGYLGSGSNSVFTITSSAIMSNVGAVGVGTYTTGNPARYNRLVISGGGKLFSASAMIGTTGSGGSLNNSARVTGTNESGQVSRWDIGKGVLTIGGTANDAGEKLTIDNYGVVTNAGNAGTSINVFHGNGSSLVITNGGKFFSTGITRIGGLSFNVLVGTNSLWDGGSNYVSFYAGSGDTITIQDGGVLTNALFGYNNQSQGANNRLIVTNGGRACLLGNTTIGDRSGSTNNSVTVTGTGSLLDNGGTMAVGLNDSGAGAGFNSLSVLSGGLVANITTLNVGNTGGTTGNTARVTAGGVLELNTGITVGKNADATSMSNSVTVSGGGLQFMNAAPTINIYNTGGTGNAMTLTNAVVSFRAITNATVLCSRTGTLVSPKVTWLGGNTFRLNAATNAASNQAYTFANTLGATNFVALSLLNGACWRGGTATIGSGGALEVGPGANVLATNMTFESGSELRVSLDGTAASSLLLTSGALTLEGSLKVTLGFAPIKDTEYPVIQTTGAGAISGVFASPKVTASYDGKAYDLTVRKTATAVSVVWASKGTLISFL